MKQYLHNHINKALNALSYNTDTPINFEKPKNEIHGDLTTNIAMIIAKSLKKNPRIIAQEIVDTIKIDNNFISKMEIAGPGFINFTFTNHFFTSQLINILNNPTNFGKINIGANKKTQVEYVSANPTGPLSVGHGRQAALGDTIANILLWAGYDVTREYYYNNAGKQMRMLAESTYARYQQLFNPDYTFPEDGYQGDYIKIIAEEIKNQFGDKYLNLSKEEALDKCKEFAEKSLFASIKKVLEKIGVVHDVFYNEDSLYKDGKIENVINAFKEKNLIYDLDGAVWFKTTDLGLEQDRVIIKSTGEPTYRLPDIAYHREKFLRGFELIVDVFGADHIATIPDVLAGVKALGFDPEKVKVVIHQFVTLMRDGEQVKMSKRLANFVTLDELIDEVGADAVRFFFLMRSSASHLEFDLNLAKEQSEKNPVYYIQYAHARIASILRFAESQNIIQNNQSYNNINFDLLNHSSELTLIKLLLEFPKTISSCAKNFEPHHITTYLHDVATAFHKFYHDCRVVVPEQEIAQARLSLCLATKIVIANGCKILHISAPESM